MYFDHVRCPSCGAQFDPEKISNRNGVASCPACQGQLDVKSLFGVAAHLAEADGPQAGIDDLVEGYGQSGQAWRTTGGYDPLAGQPPMGQAPQGERRAQGGTGLAPRPAEGEESGPSAVLKALRDIKKK